MMQFLKLIRIKHYIKNLLIFLPLIFSKNLWNMKLLLQTILAFAVFSLVASIIYIFNDLMDVEKDKLHPVKKNRPIASGKISKKQAISIIMILLILASLTSICTFKLNIKAYLIIVAYIIINISYSYKLKSVPIIDVTLLAVGYLIRVFYGASIINVEVSQWLYLTILSISFYMGMGKRRNEISKDSSDKCTREVLKYYDKSFLNKNMYMCLSLAIMFYSLWCLDITKQVNNYINIIYTIPIVIIISMKYSLNIEKEDSTGDPVEVLLNDKIMIALVIILAFIIGINYI